MFESVLTQVAAGVVVALVIGVVAAINRARKRRPRLNPLPISVANVEPTFFTKEDMSLYLWGESNAPIASNSYKQRAVMKHLLEIPDENKDEEIRDALYYVQESFPDFERLMSDYGRSFYKSFDSPVGIKQIKLEGELLIENKGGSRGWFRSLPEQSGSVEDHRLHIPEGMSLNYKIAKKNGSDEPVKVDPGESDSVIHKG